MSTSTSLLASTAWASHTHKLQSGETLDSLARKYHVSVGDIASANHLSATAVLDLGRTLLIPDPPKPVIAAATMHKTAAIKPECNRVSVRIGPGVEHRRLTMFDAGTSLIVTARRDDWTQVTLPDGRSGWVRSEFLSFGLRGKAGSEQVADNTPAPHKSLPVRHDAPAEAVSEDRRRARRRLARAHTRASVTIARKHHEEEHPRRLARASRHHSETQRIARLRHRRHTDVQVAHRRSHSEARTRVARLRSWNRLQSRWARRVHDIPEAARPAATTDVVRTAYSYRGTPYRWGGDSRGGFDCSGFTSFLYRHQGVGLPHSASAQFRMGRKVERGEMKPGDLVFFETVHKGISHVGMYVGNGRFVHASSRRSGGVRVDTLESGYYRERFRGARRFRK
jgi:cell wall-associated NlpC family hydrolase